jgi:hypothetical protein
MFLKKQTTAIGQLARRVYWWVLEDQGSKSVQLGGLTIRRK